MWAVSCSLPLGEFSDTVKDILEKSHTELAMDISLYTIVDIGLLFFIGSTPPKIYIILLFINTP